MAKRRANGEGSISKRKDGRWEGRFTIGYREDGKQIYKNVLAKTQTECAKKLKAAIAALDKRPLMCYDFIKRWKEDARWWRKYKHGAMIIEVLYRTNSQY